MATKSGQFRADETGKGQFLRGNRRNQAEERVVKDFAPGSIAGVSYFCNDRGQWLGTRAKESVAPVLASESANSLPGLGTRFAQVSLLVGFLDLCITTIAPAR